MYLNQTENILSFSKTSLTLTIVVFKFENVANKIGKEAGLTLTIVVFK